MPDYFKPNQAAWLWVVTLVLSVCTGAVSAAEPPTQVSIAPSGGLGAPNCHTAVTEAIQKARGRLAQQIQFSTAPSHNEGQGRYQGSGGTRSFTYRCLLETKEAGVSGVVFSETGEAPRAPDPAWKADMTRLSPEACEAAAATEIRAKIPRLSDLTLASGSRQLRPAPKGNTYLHGQGSLRRAEGMNPTAFTYRCELDRDTGKLLGLQTELIP
jgi:hypothetical protein